MIQMKIPSLIKKSALTVMTTLAALIFFYAPAIAAEEKPIHVVAYAQQEGMGSITSTCNDVPFLNTVDAQAGNVVIVTAQAYPKCTFEGWYVNNMLKSMERSYSFEVSADTPVYTVTARFRQNDEHLKGRAKMDISQTNWANRTCRFAEGSGSYDIAVTTAAAAQGEQCMAAFESVLDIYTIARTYNISFTKYYNKNLEVLNEPADLVFQIPEELQASGRIFRMINVYKGQPTVLMDADSSEATITFRTDKAGAYALVYRDVPSSMPGVDEVVDPQMSFDPNTEEADERIDG